MAPPIISRLAGPLCSAGANATPIASALATAQFAAMQRQIQRLSAAVRQLQGDAAGR
jgi:hypothetical protein